MPTRRARRRYTVAQLIRRRRRLTWSGMLLLLLLAGSAVLDNRGAFKYRGDDWANFDHQECQVVSVADGDTLTVRAANGGPETKVRLLGVDAPETHDPRTGKPAHWAGRATSYLTVRANGRSLVVRLEPTQTRDKYGRLLAYLYVADNENLNLSLVRDGHAYADRRFPHTLRPQVEQAENEARTKRRGLWKEVTEEQMPPWRQKWLAELRQEQKDRRPLRRSRFAISQMRCRRRRGSTDGEK